MRIVCVGGGPAGLYFSILMKLASPANEITVLERNPAGVTYGWGVVFWDDLLDDLYQHDPQSAREMHGSTVTWSGQVMRVRGQQTAHVGVGSGFSIGRRRMLDILGGRAAALGVDIRFQREVERLSEFADADLIVACDGVNSRVRQDRADHFRPEIEVGRNKYIWLGTRRIFDAFTFAFEQTAAGWIWCHAYRFDHEASTCIVECPPETWTGLGFDQLGAEQSLSVLEGIFAPYLDGQSLINQVRGLDSARWLNFKRISNETWCHENVVLMGDAAHTTHFAIGAGTKLAIVDAIALANQLHRHRDLQVALKAYEEERRGEMVTVQSLADHSARWFEEVDRHTDPDVVQFAYSLWTRRGGYSRWRYQLHLAMQHASVRRLLRWFIAARRAWRTRRRTRHA
jgi:2-polyprenyl-6-methoxyphenol hydroxylase-like FAD-dependent oxidoreductase